MMTPAKPKRMDGYIRQSRSPREGEGVSPEQQEERIRAWAKARGVHVARVEHDIDRTGARIERPGLDAILARIEAGTTDGIIVAKLDRLSRAGLIDSLKLIERIHDAGGQFASDDFGLDPTTKEGELVLGFMLGLARWEHRRLSEGWEDSKARAIARGAHIGPTPVGYTRGEDGVLATDPTYKPMIRGAFERAARGEGDTAVAKWASERFPRANRGAAWAPSEVRRWLRTRTYLGEVSHGELVNPHAHEPLIDLDTWHAAQRAPGVRRRNLSEPFPLSGVARCAHCRYAMSGQTSGGSKGATRVYRCSRSGRRDGEQHSVIVAERLERHVEALTLARIAELSDEEHERMQEPGDPAELAELERRVAEAEDAARTLATATDPDADWLGDGRDLAARLDGLRAERDAAAERVKVGEGLAMARWVWVRRRPRGASVGERVMITWADDARTLDVPGPHRPGPFPAVEW
jgi:site-specific DNA recombinase